MSAPIRLADYRANASGYPKPIATSSAYQDPMIEMREKGIDPNASGVYCARCHAERTRLDAQWGGRLCQACRHKRAKDRKPRSVTDPGDDVALLAIGSYSGGRPPVRLEDIDDIFAYVERVVQRRFYGLEDADHHEYVAEGVAIAYKLHRDKWRRDLQPSFSKYLSTLLWQRLKDHWRTDIRQQGRGRRRQEGGFEATPVASLDEMRARKVEIGHDEGGVAA